MKPATRRYLLSLAAGLALGVALFLGRGGLTAESDVEAYHLLCDAAFIPAAILLSLGLLIFVADDGVFDIFGYTIMRATVIFHRREDREALPKTYYDYHCMKHARKADSRFLLASGATCLALAFVFLIMYTIAG